MVAKAMIIAGSDSCSGAGLQADLKTFSSFGVYTTTVVTVLTAQNTAGINKSSPVDPEMIYAQIDAVMSDIGADAVKIGAIPTAECVVAIRQSLIEHKTKNIVLDPVLVGTTGHTFGDQNVTETIMDKLFPLADLITPNISEIQKLTGAQIKTFEDLKAALRELMKTEARNVLATGWVDGNCSVDLLFDGRVFTEFRASLVKNANVHGAGCTFSSAIAANIALGFDLFQSISTAKDYVTKAIQDSFAVGSGLNVLAHFQPKEVER